VIYNDTTLLKPQLLLMSETLPRADLEWLFVINKCSNLEEVLRDIAALDQLVPFALRVVVASDNSGFSHANNHGVALARSTRIALVNPDIFPAPNSGSLLNSLLSVPLPRNVLVGAQLAYGSGALMHDGMYIAENAGYDEETGSAFSLLRVEHFGKDAGAHPIERRHRLRNVPAVSGAFWQLQQETLLKLGGLSTDYFLAHYEDADFCLRLWEQGGQVRVFSPATLMHHEGVGAHGSPIGLTTRWLNRHLFSDRWRTKYKVLAARARGADSEEE
jgi:GT2 family glycosyltransferase